MDVANNLKFARNLAVLNQMGCYICSLAKAELDDMLNRHQWKQPRMTEFPVSCPLHVMPANTKQRDF